MKKTIVIHSLANDSKFTDTVELSSYCPCCGVHLSPIVLYAAAVSYDDEDENKVFILNYCPECDECFISKHTYDTEEGFGYIFDSSSPTTHFLHVFPDEVTNLSPDFVKIYNESLQAEELGLTSICGMGYRKALEFLVKDYIIHKNPSKEADVSSKMLMNCINDYIDDSRLNVLAKASTWLGNDETHYVKKHTDYSTKDLKSFINAFSTFITADLACENAMKLIGK